MLTSAQQREKRNLHRETQSTAPADAARLDEAIEAFGPDFVAQCLATSLIMTYGDRAHSIAQEIERRVDRHDVTREEPSDA